MKKQQIKKTLTVKKSNIAKLNEHAVDAAKGGFTTHGTPTPLGSLIMLCPETFDPIGCTSLVCAV